MNCTKLGASPLYARLIASKALRPGLVPANPYPVVTDVTLRIINTAGKSPPE